MGAWVDCPGGMLLDATLAATVLSSLVVMAMLGCRQPAQLLCLARAAVLGALALIPLTWLAPLSHLDLIKAARDSGLLDRPPHAVLGPNFLALPPEAIMSTPTSRPGPIWAMGPWLGRLLVPL